MAHVVNKLYSMASHIRLFSCHDSASASELVKLTNKKVFSNSGVLRVSENEYSSSFGRIYQTSAEGVTNEIKKEIMKEILLIFAEVSSMVEFTSRDFYFKSFQENDFPPDDEVKPKFRLVSLEEIKETLRAIINNVIVNATAFDKIILFNPTLEIDEIKVVKKELNNSCKCVYNAVFFLPSKNLTKDDYMNRSGKSLFECYEDLCDYISEFWLEGNKVKKIYNEKFDFSEEVYAFLESGVPPQEPNDQ